MFVEGLRLCLRGREDEAWRRNKVQGWGVLPTDALHLYAEQASKQGGGLPSPHTPSIAKRERLTEAKWKAYRKAFKAQYGKFAANNDTAENGNRTQREESNEPCEDLRGLFCCFLGAPPQLASMLRGAHGIVDCTGLHVFADYSSVLSSSLQLRCTPNRFLRSLYHSLTGRWSLQKNRAFPASCLRPCIPSSTTVF